MPKKSFICSNCGYKTSKWLGKCPECAEWNSFVEEVESAPGARGRSSPSGLTAAPVQIGGVDLSLKERTATGLDEFDRVTGGLVPGQAVLISGEPGIGKSTLLLGLAGRLADKWKKDGKKIYYVNGEESNTQVRVRAERLGSCPDNLYLYSENNTDALMERIKTDRPAAVLVDSIQTLSSESFISQAGSVVQVRESAFQLVSLCKSLDILLFIIGHITKTGGIAGPKVVEHIVDTVLFLEVDNRGFYRILRSLKNRFYSTDETGFFIMGENGLHDIDDISRAFTYQHEGKVSGISLFPLLEGNRVFPVEIQALCTPSQFNYPKRTADGVELNRLAMLAAILEKRLKLNLSSTDIYLNITNGIRVSDPALDLPVLLAVYSSYKDKALPLDTAICGEVGLTGEVRPVLRIEKRAAEVGRLGFKKIMVPNDGKSAGKNNLKDLKDIMILPVKTIDEALALLLI